MSKNISSLLTFVLILSIAACTNSSSSSSEYSAVSKEIIDKVERRVDITQEQRDKIAQLADVSGLTAGAIRTKEGPTPELKALMTQIKEEVLTPEQRIKYEATRKK